MVDLSKPLEAYRLSDGKVVPVTLDKIFDGTEYFNYSSGSFQTKECPQSNETNCQWHPDGSDYCAQNLWAVRNVGTNSDELEALRAWKADALERFPALSQPENFETAFDRFFDVYEHEGAENAIRAAMRWGQSHPNIY